MENNYSELVQRLRHRDSPLDRTCCQAADAIEALTSRVSDLDGLLDEKTAAHSTLNDDYNVLRNQSMRIESERDQLCAELEAIKAVPPVSESEPVERTIIGYRRRNGRKWEYLKGRPNSDTLATGWEPYYDDSTTAPPVTATPSEAVKELVEALRAAHSFCLSDEDYAGGPTERRVNAALAKHGTQSATLSKYEHHVIADFLQRTGQYVTNDASREEILTAYGEKVREAAAKVCDELERDENGYVVGDGDAFAAAIRSMPIPATQSSPALVPDSQCVQGKCCMTTTGCAGECWLKKHTMGGISVVLTATPAQSEGEEKNG